ncbi:uncharacterized protein LOC132935854 isoform X2 [Metopolophium dirhodum]|uniref:uncharacterized protein LOC132935854 isoform X2 n=1 Tax=Metopolophium dirhodum TaxID=44670 RepID=UPI00298FCBD1|nr:uncharacterized protein LOC132935854 isoform X2 [Metopolophium dirhodum]
MHYPVGYNRSLMIVLLVTYFIRVGSATPLEKWGFPETEPGPPPPGTSSTPPFRLLEAAQRAAAALVRDTARVSDKVLWSFGKMLLSAGESVNYVWDAALNATVQLLKAGGAACGSVAERLAHVPVIGFGASGVHEVVGVAVNAVASNVAHDSVVRGQALAALNAKLNESGARLRPAAGETGAPAQATTATDQQGPVSFFPIG